MISTYLVCATDSLCTNFRQTDVIELSFPHQFIEHFGVVLDLVIRVAPRGLEQIELLCPAEGLDDSIDAPAQVLLAPVGIYLAGESPALDGEERAVGVLGILLEEARNEIKVSRAHAWSVELG